MCLLFQHHHNNSQSFFGHSIAYGLAVEFVSETGSEGNYRPGNFALKFENKALNRFLGEWADLKTVIDGAKSIVKEGDIIKGLPVDTWAEEFEKIFKLRQMQNSIMLDNSDSIKERIQNKKKTSSLLSPNLISRGLFFKLVFLFLLLFFIPSG